MSGGHVRSLPWAWGALGERDTACSTRRSRRSRDMRAGRAPRARQLGSRPRGSTGVLLLDTKVLTATARVSGDALRAGRQVMLGGGFRSWVGLAHALADKRQASQMGAARCRDLGDFPQRLHEENGVVENGVVYLIATSLPEWLAPTAAKIGLELREDLVRRAVATGGNRWQMRDSRNGSNKPTPLPLVATSRRSERMVRRGSTVEPVRGLQRNTCK